MLINVHNFAVSHGLETSSRLRIHNSTVVQLRNIYIVNKLKRIHFHFVGVLGSFCASIRKFNFNVSRNTFYFKSY